MKDYRTTTRVPARNGIASAVVVALLAVVVIVGPHLLRASPTTNESTDPANGVRATADAGSAARCRIGRAPAWMTLRGDLELAAASLCVPPRGSGDRSDRSTSFPLSPAQLRQVEADFNAHATTSPTLAGDCRTQPPSTAVSGVTVDGQEVLLYADGCTGEFAGIGRYWVPSAATRATLSSVLGDSGQRRP
jgi:hypothetical protein